MNHAELQSLMAPFQAAVRRTTQVQLGAHQVTLALLGTDAELDSWQYTLEARRDISDPEFALLFRRRLLAHAVVAMNGVPIPAEVVVDGTEPPVRRLKVDALESQLSQMPQVVISQLHMAYAHFAAGAETELEGLIKFDKIDVDTEILNLERRLGRLKQMRKDTEVPTTITDVAGELSLEDSKDRQEAQALRDQFIAQTRHEALNPQATTDLDDEDAEASIMEVDTSTPGMSSSGRNPRFQ